MATLNKMEEIKKLFIEVFNKNAETTFGRGSCGELGDAFQTIYSDDFYVIVDELLVIIQALFDPENQPNQFGIENPFEFKYCMPDDINSKEEHEEYLKAIGYNKFTKCLDCSFIACENHNKCIKNI